MRLAKEESKLARAKQEFDEQVLGSAEYGNGMALIPFD